MERIKQSYDRSSVVFSENIMFADWVLEWINHKEPQLAKTTLEAYRSYANNRIIPYFKNAHIVLQKLTGIDIQRFYDQLLTDGLSPVSLRRYHAVVNGSLEYAYKLGIIPENPAKRVDLPHMTRSTVGTAYTHFPFCSILRLADKHKGPTANFVDPVL